jgi:tetratricopeptide (TPR) repeat protein
LKGHDTRRECAWLHTMIAYEAVPDWKRSKRHYEHALKLQRELGYRGQVAYRLVNVAWTNIGLGEHDQARQNLEEGLTLFRAASDQFGALFALEFLGHLAMNELDFAEAATRYKEALSMARAQGDEVGIARVLGILGEQALGLGDFEAAVRYLDESVAVSIAMGMRTEMVTRLTKLGAAMWYSGKFDQAHTHLDESLSIAWEMEVPRALAIAATYRAWLDAANGRYEAARRHARSAISQCQGGTANQSLVKAKGLLGWVALAIDDREAAERLLEEAITAASGIHAPDLVQKNTAWLLGAMGGAAFRLGKRSEAKQHILEALRLATEFRAFIPLVHLMPVIPLVLAGAEDTLTETERKVRAVEIYALAQAHPFVAKARLFEDIAGASMRSTIASLPPDVAAAAQARGRALDWWETADALLAELRALGWGERELRRFRLDQ